MKAIKWAMVYGQIEAEVFDSLEEAADMAEGASEYGSESLLYIEHDGTLYDIDWVDDRAAAKRAERPPAPPARPFTHRMEVHEPVRGKWADYGGYRSVAEAQRDYYELVEVVGEDRVRLIPVD